MRARTSGHVFALSLASLSVGSLMASPLAAQVTTHPREMGLPTPESTRPDPSEHRLILTNGLTVYAAVDRAAPLVTLTAFIGAGHVDGVGGAAELIANTLRAHGPAGMGARDFQGALRAMAAEYAVMLGPEGIEIMLDVPAEDAPVAVALLADLLLKGPAISEDDLTSLRSRARPSQAGGAESGTVAYEGSLESAVDLFRHRILGSTRYRPTPSLGETEALNLGDARAYHERFFVTGNVVLAVAGSFEISTLRSSLEEAFGGMRSGSRNKREVSAAPPPAAGRRIFTYPADKLQGWLVIGHELPTVPLEDQAPLEVMNYILGGGHFDTRLFRAARDRRGLANDDSGFLEQSTAGPGTYSFRTGGRPETVRLLLHLTIEEIDIMRSQRVSEEELFVATGALADGVFAAGYRDGWATARTLAAEWSQYGSHDASASYQDRIRSVTIDDVLEVARRYMSPDRMQVVLIGPLDAINAAPSLEGEGALSEYGEVVRGR